MHGHLCAQLFMLLTNMMSSLYSFRNNHAKRAFLPLLQFAVMAINFPASVMLARRAQYTQTKRAQVIQELHYQEQSNPIRGNLNIQ